MPLSLTCPDTYSKRPYYYLQRLKPERKKRRLTCEPNIYHSHIFVSHTNTMPLSSSILSSQSAKMPITFDIPPHPRHMLSIDESSFQLQTPGAGTIAARRSNRRAALLTNPARNEHSKQWTAYVADHEEFAEQVDEDSLRADSFQHYFGRPAQSIAFHPIDYASELQPVTEAAKRRDGEPVSPGTQLSFDQMSRQEVVVAFGIRDPSASDFETSGCLQVAETEQSVEAPALPGLWSRAVVQVCEAFEHLMVGIAGCAREDILSGCWEEKRRWRAVDLDRAHC